MSLDVVKGVVHLYDNITLIPEELQEDFYQDHLKYSLKFCTYLGEPDRVEFPYEKMASLITRTD